MADPVITDWYRVLAVWEGPSGLPEDRFINSWAFRNDGIGGIEGVEGAVTAVLQAFYFGSGTQTEYPAKYMNTNVTLAEYRIYDLGQTPPREPRINPIGVPGESGGVPLPGEVALCLSLRTDDRTARGRGRLYLGPLVSSALASSGGIVRPNSLLVQGIVDSANDVLNTTENVTWGIISQRDGTAKPVTGGYVDDAFDTQRRRGIAPSTRTVFGGYTAPA